VSKKIEEIKQRLVEFWQCTNTASETCNFVFPVLPKHKLYGIVKRLLIACIIGNISAKRNIKICSRVSIASWFASWYATCFRLNSITLCRSETWSKNLEPFVTDSQSLVVIPVDISYATVQGDTPSVRCSAPLAHNEMYSLSYN